MKKTLLVSSFIACLGFSAFVQSKDKSEDITVPMLQHPYFSHHSSMKGPHMSADHMQRDPIPSVELSLAGVNDLIQTVKKGVCNNQKGIEVAFAITVDPETLQPMLSYSNNKGIMVNIECDDD